MCKPCHIAHCLEPCQKIGLAAWRVRKFQQFFSLKENLRCESSSSDFKLTTSAHVFVLMNRRFRAVSFWFFSSAVSCEKFTNINFHERKRLSYLILNPTHTGFEGFLRKIFLFYLRRHSAVFSNLLRKIFQEFPSKNHF